jgi:protein-disulfide isomerase
MSTANRREHRAARLAAQRAAAEQAARRRRLARLGTVAAAALVAVVIAAAVSSSGGTTDTRRPAAGGADAAALFRGIPEHDGVLGDPNAPLTVTEFLDLQCPFCAEASKRTLPTLVRDYVRTGKVKLEARTLQFIGPESTTAARAAAGAERQGRLWPFLEVFYANQGPENSGYVTEALLRRVATAAGADAEKALSQADGAFARERLARADADARRLGIDSTPSFVVSGKGTAPHVLRADVLDPQSVAAALDRELAR